MASNSTTCSRCPELGSGKKYHCSMLYNYHQGRKSTMDDDHKLSLEFVKKLDSVLTKEGFNNNYYYDKCVLGTNLFDMIASMIDKSDKFVVVFTKGFISNCWHKYSDQSVFASLLDSGKKHKFIPVAIGLDKTDFTADVGINPERITYFEDSWEEDKASWVQLVQRFDENYHGQEKVSSNAFDNRVEAVASDIETLNLEVKELSSSNKTPGTDTESDKQRDNPDGMSQGGILQPNNSDGNSQANSPDGNSQGSISQANNPDGNSQGGISQANIPDGNLQGGSLQADNLCNSPQPDNLEIQRE